MNTPVFPHPNVNVGIFFMTPEKATEILGRNHGNRNPKRENLAKIRESLMSGEFKFNGASICIGENGELLDGQHRLMECVNTGIGFWTVLVTGIPRDAMATIDTGAVRKPGDILRIAGAGGNTEASIVATIIRIERYGVEKGIVSQANGRAVRPSDILKRIEAEPDLRELVRLSLAEHKKCGLTPRIYAALYWMFSSIDQNDADEFFSKLATGAGLSEQNPILTLRNRLFETRSQARIKGRVTDTLVVAYAIKAWNKWRQNEPMKIVRHRGDEAFPHPI